MQVQITVNDKVCIVTNLREKNHHYQEVYEYTLRERTDRVCFSCRSGKKPSFCFTNLCIRIKANIGHAKK